MLTPQQNARACPHPDYYAAEPPEGDGWDVCRCGAYDLWNGSVVCWVCEEIVVNWDIAQDGFVTAATLPGHEPFALHWLREQQNEGENA